MIDRSAIYLQSPAYVARVCVKIVWNAVQGTRALRLGAICSDLRTFDEIHVGLAEPVLPQKFDLNGVAG